ncbi:MAG TPA: hypothetical protein DEQ47_03260 [Solibacterales bacterium]|nr:hypothetical protein [Bryobacterales bacterium]
MRLCLLAVLGAMALCAQSDKTVITGKLLDGGVLETNAQQLIQLNGDRQTDAVLHDKRLAGDIFELHGHFEHNTFHVDPRHTGALFVKKDGKLLAVTYWCDVCSIRTFAPGLCMCCQQETKVDLRDPASIE